MTVLSLALAGCSQPEVGAVKAATVPEDPTHTYGSALSNRESCAQDEWRTFNDDTSRLVVEYRCTLKNGVDLLAAMRQQKIRETQDEYQKYYRGLDQSIESTKQGPATSEKLLAEAQDKLAKLQASSDSAQNHTQMADEDPAQALRRAAVNNEMGVGASAKFAVEQAQRHLTNAKANLEKDLASLQRERTRFERAEKDALAQIDKSYNGITKASEVFRWFFRDSHVVPAWSGVELLKQDGSVAHWNKDWKLTVRDLLHHRGEDHVRYVLNAPANVTLGRATTSSEPAPTTTASESHQQSGNQGEACYDAKVKDFRDGMGEEAPINNDMINEWRGLCGLLPA
ncbi:hypothetical protein KME70_14575 [Ralstonia solanacearum]|nr:hypothetical protein KME70_14575 [Ralstonia solanacearum]